MYSEWMMSSVRRSDMSRQLKVNGICSWPRAPMRSPVVRRSSSENVGEPSASSASAERAELALVASWIVRHYV